MHGIYNDKKAKRKKEQKRYVIIVAGVTRGRIDPPCRGERIETRCAD